MKNLFLLLILIFTCGPAKAENVAPDDFAEGFYLSIDRKAPLYRLEVPEEVYKTVRSADLYDVRVFNSEGEVVPHEFRTVQVDQATLRDKKSLPFFPLHQQSGISGDPAGLSLQVSRDPAGTIVNIKTDPSVDTLNQDITGYLLDLGGLKRAASELEFHWQKDIDSSVFTVNIQESSDLVQWRSLVQRATLVDLDFAEQKVEKRTIELPRPPLKYLKMTWLKSSRQLRISEVIGFTEVIENHRERRWLTLGNGTVLEKNDRTTIDFATDYRMPVSSAQVLFAVSNSIARLSVQSRPDEKANWTARCEQVFYYLSFEGNVISNEPCNFQPTADSLWRVAVEQDGAGLQSATSRISLQLGRQPSELLFVARGTPPYLLAFGSGKYLQANSISGDGMLLQTIQGDDKEKMIGQARPGEKIRLGGELALQAPAKPMPWKKWLLWAVLVLGVGLLAFMVRSLSKEMNKVEEKKVSEKR